MPKVSVNIPVYNDEKYIRETLDSALNQTYKNIEVVIVDDGSTDQTANIIKGYNDPRIKYFYQQNMGIGAARNKALKESSGEFIAFLDHDDLWFPSKLEKQLSLFEKKPELGLVFCDTVFFNDHGDLYSIYQNRKPPRGRVFKDILKWYFLSCETVVIRKSVIQSVGRFPDHMNMAEEYDLFLRIAYKYPIDYVDEPLAKYRIHENNYSWGKDLRAIEEEGEALVNLIDHFREAKQVYGEEIEDIRRRLLIRKVLLYWKKGQRSQALNELKGVRGGLKTTLLKFAVRFFNFELYCKLDRNPFLKR